MTSGCHGDLGPTEGFAVQQVYSSGKINGISSPSLQRKAVAVRQNENVKVLSVGELVTYCATIVGVI